MKMRRLLVIVVFLFATANARNYASPIRETTVLTPDAPALSKTTGATPIGWPIVENDLASIPGGEYIWTSDPISPGTPDLAGSLFSPTASALITEAPEPASLYLFGIALCVSLWLLTRMIRDDQASQEPLTEDES